MLFEASVAGGHAHHRASAAAPSGERCRQHQRHHQRHTNYSHQDGAGRAGLRRRSGRGARAGLRRSRPTNDIEGIDAAYKGSPSSPHSPPRRRYRRRCVQRGITHLTATGLPLRKRTRLRHQASRHRKQDQRARCMCACLRDGARRCHAGEGLTVC